MKGAKKINWFKNENRLKWIKSRALRSVYFDLVMNDNFYAYQNKKYIDTFQDVYGSYELTKTEKRIISDMNSHGVAVANLDEFFSEDMLELLLNRFDKKLEADRATVHKKLDYIREVDLNGDLTEDTVISKYIFNRSLLNIVNIYMGQIARLGYKEESLAFTGSDNKRSNARHWHRDGADKKIIKIFLYLNDVTKKNGAFEYIKDTHYKGVFADISSLKNTGLHGGPKGSDRLQPLVDSMTEVFDQRIFTAEGSAGTLVFCDTSGIHRGGHCVDGERKALSLAYYSNSAFLSLGAFSLSKQDQLPDELMYKLTFGLR